MVVFLSPFDRMMSADGSGLSSVGLEQLAALSKLSTEGNGEGWLDAIFAPSADGSSEMDFEFPWSSLNDGSSDNGSSHKRSGDDMYNSAPKRRKSTITLAAVRDALHKTNASKAEAIVKEEGKATTLFAGKPMSKDELVKLQGKLEKNRVMAREARKKKKEYVTALEDKLKTYELKLVSMQHRLLEAERQNVALLAQLAHVTAAAQAQLAVASAGGHASLMPMLATNSGLSVAGNNSTPRGVIGQNPGSDGTLRIPHSSPMMQDVSPAGTPRGTASDAGFCL